MKIYISEITGSVYWIENNCLMYAPMPINGTVDTDNDGGEVDLGMMKGEIFSNGQGAEDFYADICGKLKES